MTSQRTTYRTLAEDEDAPPPYDPIAPSTTPQKIQTTQTLQSYPALDTSQNRHVPEATPEPPPPSIGYYPAMTVSAPPRPSPIATSASPYPQYPIYSPIITMTMQPTMPVFQPYPVFNPHVPGSVQGVAYPVMSNPGSTRPYPTMEPGPQNVPQQPLHPAPISAGSWDSHQSLPAPLPICTPANGPRNPFDDGPQIVERDLINLEDSPDHKSSFISDGLSPSLALASPALVTPSVPPVPPTPSELETSGPSLVTIYRCKKCGAVLDSETANCKKLHTLTVLLGEQQVRNVTRPDYGVSGSRVPSDDARSTPMNNTGASNGTGSLGPQNNHLFAQPESGRQSHDHQRGTYEQYPQYQSRHEERVENNPESNYGTDDVYLRRSFTAGAVKSLKGLWKRQSQTEHQIVTPPPLPMVAASLPHSYAPVNNYQSSLARSNTFSHPTPPFNPAYNPQPHPPHHYQQPHHPTYPLYAAPQGHFGYSAQQPPSQPPFAPSPW